MTSPYGSEALDKILLDGVLALVGMPSYKKILNAKHVQASQAYIVARARLRQDGL